MDPEISKILAAEAARQSRTVNLIPSENYPSAAVRAGVGSILSAKYGEGQAGARFYQGGENIDEIETLAKTRAAETFGAKFANVQAHSGSPANLAVYFAVAAVKKIDPRDLKILAPRLADGGHLTHGHAVSATGKLFHFRHFSAPDGRPDLGEIEKIARDFCPDLIVVGGTAFPRLFDFKKCGEIARAVGARLHADISHEAGLIAAGVLPNPFFPGKKFGGAADEKSGGEIFAGADIAIATTHKTLRGPRGAVILTRDDPELARAIDRAVFPGLQGGPHFHTIAGIAQMFFEVGTEDFKKYARAVLENAKTFAESLAAEGFELVSGGTENHLILVDLRPLGIPGKDFAEALEAAGIVANANAIPGDPAPPARPSGLRVGAPAMTTRGFGPEDFRAVAGFLGEIARGADPAKIRPAVEDLAGKFPVPGV